MNCKQRNIVIIINIACVLALIVVLFPLLMLAKYNYPSADDWSYGACTYDVIQKGGGFLEFVRASLCKTLDTYLHVEGRFVGIFFATLQPGIWGEQCYVIVPWLLLGMVICSELCLFKYVLGRGGKKENRWLWLPVIVPSLIMQILYCPYAVESFYWYTGAMYYTFSYALSLFLFVLFDEISTSELVDWKFVTKAICTGIFAFAIGGMNFGTSLACLLLLCILTVYNFIYNKRAVFRTWYVVVLSAISLLLCIFAPGNVNRIVTNFGGETQGPIEAVVMSLVRSATNIYSWTNIKVILMLAFTVPFIWKCIKSVNWKFNLPGLFTILTFGLYASQCTATMYVDGTTGGGRMAAVLFYTYHVWLIGNLIYWIGWLNRKQNKLQRILEQVKDRYGKYLLPYCVVICILLMSLIYFQDLREINSYRAYRDWRQGWAQQYAAEWEERLEVLHDDSVKDVVFEPMSVYPEMILYTDLQDEYGYTWVNYACAEYYGKNSIVVKSAQ